MTLTKKVDLEDKVIEDYTGILFHTYAYIYVTHLVYHNIFIAIGISRFFQFGYRYKRIIYDNGISKSGPS